MQKPEFNNLISSVVSEFLADKQIELNNLHYIIK